MKNTNVNHNESTMNNFDLNIDNFERTMNLLESTGLNWEVKKEPLFHGTGKETDFFGIFKYDQPTDQTPSKCFGTVKDRYRPFQNWELADTIVRATDGIGIVTNKGGQLSGGSKVFLQAELPDEYVGKSDVKRWVTVLNSHDGSSSIGFGSTNMVVVCQNTFHRAFKDTQKFRHTESAKERIETAVRQFQQTIAEDKRMFDTFKRMSELRPDESIVQAVINKLFSVDVNNTKRDDISTRKVNQLQQFAQAYNTERDLEGDTVWGLFNAVTRYTNHIAAPDNHRKNEYLMTGTGFDLNNTAYDTIVKWLDERTAKTVVSFA
jgi:phage/plasmid-like protein (TIGR03299 family)